MNRLQPLSCIPINLTDRNLTEKMGEAEKKLANNSWNFSNLTIYETLVFFTVFHNKGDLPKLLSDFLRSSASAPRNSERMCVMQMATLKLGAHDRTGE